jgi:hypothetical protein
MENPFLSTKDKRNPAHCKISGAEICRAVYLGDFFKNLLQKGVSLPKFVPVGERFVQTPSQNNLP